MSVFKNVNTQYYSIIFIFLYSFKIHDSYCQLKGISCVFRSSHQHRPGTCLPLSDCPTVFNNLSQRRPQRCGQQRSKNDPTVCCPWSVSDLKCKEYLDVAKKYLETEPAIVGGENALSQEFPHMAALGYGPENSIKWKCGGSLISSEYILTAAHCLPVETNSTMWVRLGDLNLNSTGDDSKPQTLKVFRTIIHPNYRPPLVYNDIALLQLSGPVVFNSYVRPACLETNYSFANNSKPIATGWGSTGFVEEQSPILQKVRLDIFSSKECRKAFRSVRNRRLPRNVNYATQICAGGKNSMKDTCQGDSGGPLQIRRPDVRDTYNIIGVISVGLSCGGRNIPGIYTRVSAYTDWIEKTAWATQL